MKIVISLFFVLAITAGVGFLVRNNFIVLDGYVTWWQVKPVLDRGKIANDREYRAVQYYVEQIFESGGFDRTDERTIAEKLNVLLASYHTKPSAPEQ